jgi:hypothetical protein
VFFNTAEALDPDQDTNGAVDVYEWRSGGTAGCESPRGCQSLLSSGQSREASYFAAASPGGGDVFLITRERLLRGDGDSNFDLYDARVGGGFPEPEPAPSPCVGDACLLAPVAPPSGPSVASATLAGPGNLKQRKRQKGKQGKRCRAGKARGQRKCAKKNSKQTKRQRAVRNGGVGR